MRSLTGSKHNGNTTPGRTHSQHQRSSPYAGAAMPKAGIAELDQAIASQGLTAALLAETVEEGSVPCLLHILSHARLTAKVFRGVQQRGENIMNLVMNRFVSSRLMSDEEQVQVLRAVAEHKHMCPAVFNKPSTAYGNYSKPYPALLAACEYSKFHLLEALMSNPHLSAEHVLVEWVEPREGTTSSVLAQLITRFNADTCEHLRRFLALPHMTWWYFNDRMKGYGFAGNYLEYAATVAGHNEGGYRVLIELLGSSHLIEPLFRDFAKRYVEEKKWCKEWGRGEVLAVLEAHRFAKP